MTNVVHMIDNMEFMTGLPDNAFDLAIVDPPYGIGNFLHPSKKYFPDKIKWNDKPPSPKYFEELFRISKHQIIWGGNYFAHILPITNSWILWDKKNGDPIKSHFSNSEVAWTSFNIAMNCVCIPWPNGFYRKRKEGMQIHTCQKPVTLYKWLLANYAKPGQTIFDSHVGSGSIRIACHDMGFDFVGCENDPDYWQAQEDRYREWYQKGKELFTTEEYHKIIYE